MSQGDSTSWLLADPLSVKCVKKFSVIGEEKKGRNLMKRICLTWFVVMSVGLPLCVRVQAQSCSTGLLVLGFDRAKHERFYPQYPGPNSQFIGDGYDWSGIGKRPQAANQCITMISPKVAIASAHRGAIPVAGAQFEFVSGDGYDGVSAGTYTVAEVAAFLGEVAVVRLTQPVSSAIKKYSILKLTDGSGNIDYGSYAGRILWLWGRSCPTSGGTYSFRLGRNVVGLADANDILFWYPPTAAHDSLGDDEAKATEGDSSHPGFIMAGGEPRLVGTFWTPTQLSNLVDQIDQINAQIQTWFPNDPSQLPTIYVE